MSLPYDILQIRDSAAKLSPAAVASGGDASKEVKKPAAPAKDTAAAKKQPPAKVAILSNPSSRIPTDPLIL